MPFSNYLMGLDPIKNHFLMYCHNSLCSLFSLFFLSLSTDFLCPWVFSQMSTTSHNLFLLSHRNLFYLAVDIIWHSIVVCWVNCFHDVSPYLTHSLDVSLILFVLSDKFDSQCITPNISMKYLQLWWSLSSVEWGILFKTINSCADICSASMNSAGRPHFQVLWPAFVPWWISRHATATLSDRSLPSPANSTIAPTTTI